ncbi:EamA/RhaT family transporter, partial [Mesorhizobium sp. M00.F.Ca.ET.158.01.1.1]
FFAGVPRSTTVIGAALIIGAGLLALNTERRTAPAPALVARDPA